MAKSSKSKSGARSWTQGLDAEQVHEALEEATVDAHDEDEQHSGLLSLIEDELAFPFPAKVLGEVVSVVGMEWPGDDGFGLDLVCERNGEQHRILRKLESRFAVLIQPSELVGKTRQDIADATDFDSRDINHNFNFDYDAYEAVARGLKQLIQLDFPSAMELALELMKAGSYQVEMSDEGLMTSSIEDCLRPVVQGLTESNIPTKEIVAWCDAMTRADRGGFILYREIANLKRQSMK
jgi:hypothetical protein